MAFGLNQALKSVKDGNVEAVREIIASQDRAFFSTEAGLLQNAIWNNHPQIVSELLQAGSDSYSRDFLSRALHYASDYFATIKCMRPGLQCKHGDIVKQLISFGAEINHKDDTRQAPLHTAAKFNHIQVVDVLLSAGADPNVHCDSGRTPLHAASCFCDFPEGICKHGEIAELLLRYGAKTEADSLQVAVKNKSIDVARVLLQAGVNVNALSSEVRGSSKPWAALHLAACKGYSEIMSLLILYGAIVDLRDNEENTPLHWAVKNNDAGAIEVLLKAGANCNVKNEKNSTPLHFAAQNGYPEIITLLIRYGADATVDLRDKEHNTTLHLAVKNNREDATEVLLKAGATPDARGERYRTSLHFAALNGYSKIITLLIRSGASINLRDREQNTPLHLAVKNNREDLMVVLLKAGAAPDAKNENNRTPLHFAVQYGYPEVISLLIRYGATVDIRDREENTSLYLAAKNKKAGKMEVLLKAGSDPDAKSEKNRTPLHFSAENGYPEIISLLIRYKATVDVRDMERNTPLHLAVKNKKSDAMEVLLKAGSDPDAKNRLKSTPLHFAAQYGDCESVELLLKFGAKVNVQRNDKITPLHLASRRNQQGTNIVALLLLKGADINNITGYQPRTAICDAKSWLDRSYRFRNGKCFCETELSILERHVAMMKMINMDLCGTLQNYGSLTNCSTHSSAVRKFEEGCREESSRLSITYIGNSTVTYYSFLKKSGEKLLTVIKNEDIRRILESDSYKNEFTHFASLISNQFHKGLYRLKLIEKIRPNIGVILKNLTDECVDEILSYLSDEDILHISVCLRF